MSAAHARFAPAPAAMRFFARDLLTGVENLPRPFTCRIAPLTLRPFFSKPTYARCR